MILKLPHPHHKRKGIKIIILNYGGERIKEKGNFELNIKFIQIRDFKMYGLKGNLIKIIMIDNNIGPRLI